MLTILNGDALEELKKLPNESVQCCVTSPPYWGLRDYGNCECATKRHASAGFLAWDGAKRNGHSGPCPPNDARCIKEPDPNCPACRGSGKIHGVADTQLGLEKTPEEYVAKMVEVFREVRRVLKGDGTFWLNLGDSYANDGKWGGHTGGKHVKALHCSPIGRNKRYTGLKPKDLIGIPWMVGFALRSDGWWLRSDIIWAKPNPMPESVTDRPTKSHEYLFLLTKNANYFYDAEAIKEKGTTTEEQASSKWASRRNGTGKGQQEGIYHGCTDSIPFGNFTGNRNKRSVWTIATAPYPEAHFATYPPDLIKPCIMAGSRVGDTVLDPFSGSGTTGMVALELGRKAVLIELNPKYVELIRQRCDVTPGLALA